MAIECIQYNPGEKIASTGANYSMKMAFLSYAQDGHGMSIDSPTTQQSAASNPELQIRSYYTVKTNEAEYANKPLTFESIMQLIATKRARIVEAEIPPMSNILENRNAIVEQHSLMLGTIAAGMTQQQQDKKDNKNSEGWGNAPGLGAHLLKYFTTDELQNAAIHQRYANLLEWAEDHSGASDSCRSSQTEGVFDVANSLVKAKIDYLNNETQTDMARLNNLVQKRDESFEMASSLTSIVADGRADTIRNMGG